MLSRKAPVSTGTRLRIVSAIASACLSNAGWVAAFTSSGFHVVRVGIRDLSVSDIEALPAELCTGRILTEPEFVWVCGMSDASPEQTSKRSANDPFDSSSSCFFLGRQMGHWIVLGGANPDVVSPHTELIRLLRPGSRAADEYYVVCGDTIRALGGLADRERTVAVADGCHMGSGAFVGGPDSIQEVVKVRAALLSSFLTRYGKITHASVGPRLGCVIAQPDN